MDQTTNNPTLQSEKPERPCEAFVNPLNATEALHRAILCASCRWPFGAHVNSRAPVVAPQADANRRIEIALGYIKRAANRELPKLPCLPSEMTEREAAIFNVCAAASGNLQFIARELDAMDSWLPSPASSPVPPRDCIKCGHECGGDEQGCEAVVTERPLAFCGCRCEFPAATPTPVEHPFGPCGYRYCDWPDGELRCNETRTTPSPSVRSAAEEIAEIYGLQHQVSALTGIITRHWLSSDDLNDLCETLEMAAGDLDTEGLGDTDSCIFARKWAARLRGESETES